jgi:mono/diheme cytochrome c family protein
VKQISILTVGLAAAALAIGPASAEDFTAGKTPAQLFRSDCSACHQSPNGLVKRRGNVGEVTAFLSEHYTTKFETAAALAAYVSGFAPAYGTGRERTRNYSESDVPVTGADVPTDPTLADEPRHRRASDSDRRRAHEDGDAPRPPRGIAAAPGAATASPTNAPAGEPHEANGPVSRHSRLHASTQGGKTGAPKKNRKHRPVTDDVKTGEQGGAPAPPAPAPKPDAAAESAPEPSPAAGSSQ